MKTVAQFQQFPQRIENLTFEKVFTESNPNSVYTFAIYTDEKGKKYFCKRWQGEKKDYAYHWICNEIEVYRCFKRLYVEHGTVIRNVFPEIKIPTIVASHCEEKNVYLITEFVTGTKLELENEERRALVFSRVIEYFTFISPLISQQKHTIPHFSRTYLFLLFHYYALVSLFSFKFSPTKMGSILFAFYRGAFTLFMHPNNQFVHRDLGFGDNIIIHNNTIQIIDFQLSGISNPMVEVANITMALWEDKTMRKRFLNSPYIVDLLNQQYRKKQFHAFLAHAFVVSTSLQLRSKTRVRDYIINKFSPTVLGL